MIDLLYHATIYYEIRKYIQESEPATLKYEMVIEKAKAHEKLPRVQRPSSFPWRSKQFTFIQSPLVICSCH